MRSNVGDLHNHNLYWEALVTREQSVPEKLGKAISGCFENFKNESIECSMS
ncbi:MAG: hypothetical protein LBB19_01065 [Puniceicoccales bacterium]|nr:hypothetical protein [Puniceicoccales bacterium]